MRRPGAVAVFLVAGALAVTGCADGSSRERERAAATSTSIPLSVTGRVDLRRLVVTRAPEGYDQLASPPFGAVDLQRLLEEFSDAPVEDKVILERAGFEAGYTRGWLRENPRAFLGVFVFEFGDEAGARAARDGFAAQNEARKGARRFTVEGIVGAIGESYTQQAVGSPPERVHIVTFVRGARLYQVGGQFADEATPVDETVRFAEAEDRVAS